MQSAGEKHLLAADIGNSRVKLGLFATAKECVEKAASGLLPIAAAGLPTPFAQLALDADAIAKGELASWLNEHGGAIDRVAIASVCPPSEELLIEGLAEWFAANNMAPVIAKLRAADTPIEVLVDEPEHVGVDRVVAAAAANRLRKPATPAIVIDIGTAITVDLVSAAGEFVGGAILPGPTLAGRALAEGAALLPLVTAGELDVSPDAVGENTVEALQAGLYWGAVGSIRELIARQRDRLTAAPQVFLTGSASPAFARLIGGPDYTVRHVPVLTLAGVALAAQSMKQEARP